MGKVNYIGASFYASWQLAHANVMAELKGWTRFVVLQSEYNMLKRGVEREVLPYAGPMTLASCLTIPRWRFSHRQIPNGQTAAAGLAR